MPAFVPSIPWKSFSFIPSLRDIVSLRQPFERILLQSTHRLAAIAFFSTLAAWVLIYRTADAKWAIAAAFAASDLGLCAALAARTMTRNYNTWREARAAAIINLILLLLSLQLMLLGRLETIRAAIESFFS